MGRGARPTTALVVAVVILGLAACQPTATATLSPAAEATSPVASTPTAAHVSPTSSFVPTPAPATIVLPPVLALAPAHDPFAANLPPAEIAFALPPAIQHVTETSAILYFAFDKTARGAVFYRSATTPVESIPFETNTASHLVTIPDLQPSTTYDVLVVIGAEPDVRLPTFLGEIWGQQTISTPPYALLRFAAIGDSGFGDETTPMLAGQMLVQRPAFVLLSGDIVYRAYEQGDPGEAFRLKYFRPYASILHHMPIYPAIGNHDLEPPTEVAGVPFYFTVFPPFAEPTFPAWNGEPLRKWYAFSSGRVQFLSLDSQALFGDAGRVEQQAWLEKRLADPNYDYTIPFFHISPYSSSLHRAEGLAVQPWAELFEAAHVPLVISAHDHSYERLVHGPTTYVISGGGSGTLYGLKAPQAGSQFFASESHFTLFEAYPDRIEVRAIGKGGEVIDEAMIETGR